jgi:hypothetical protein
MALVALTMTQSRTGNGAVVWKPLELFVVVTKLYWRLVAARYRPLSWFDDVQMARKVAASRWRFA